MDQFEFTVVNAAFGGSMRGIKVIQQIIPMSTSSIKVRNIFHINVQQITN